MKKKVAVAMSGGVDSSLTAALLKQEGYDVIGITMLLFDEGLDSGGDTADHLMSGAAADARQVAEVLSIPHHVMDFRSLFREKVIGNFLQEYGRGRTPNPCIVCNRYLKFGKLLEQAQKLGADYLATGHYARIEQGADGRFLLKKGLEAQKDQSYVLYHLQQEDMEHIMLPLGKYTKEKVRLLAESFDLPVAQKPDSQEICFIPDNDYRRYLCENMPECHQPGDIVDIDGNRLGRHEGVAFYTIGQRRNLGIAAGRPLYVTAIDKHKNQVVVGDNAAVFAAGMIVEDLHWTLPEFVQAPPVQASVRIRYGKKETMSSLRLLADGRLQVSFDEPQRAVTPGQSAVFYDGDVVLGGGVIVSL